MKDKTSAYDVIDAFESSFADKHVIPFDLEMIWLEKAIGRFSVEIEPINFDREILSFDKKLDVYVVDTLAQLMKKFYQERELSKVNKRVSIVGKDLSLNSNMSSSKYAESELNYVAGEVLEMLDNQKPSAYN